MREGSIDEIRREQENIAEEVWFFQKRGTMSRHAHSALKENAAHMLRGMSFDIEKCVNRRRSNEYAAPKVPSALSGG
jgi:hypothetical protein